MNALAASPSHSSVFSAGSDGQVHKQHSLSEENTLLGFMSFVLNPLGSH